MLGMSLAIITILIIWATARLIPEKFQPYSAVGYFLAEGVFSVFRLYGRLFLCRAGL